MAGTLKQLAFLAVAVAMPQIASAVNLPTTPVNAIQNSGSSSFFSMTFTGIGTGYDVSDNTPYLGWCAEQETTAVNFSPTVTLYNTIDPATPTQGNLALPGGHAGHNWPKVNYVLNHKQGGVNDVQYVIWHYVNGVNPTSVPASAATAAMIADADANGGAFVPQPGQITAVLLYQDGYGNFAQDTLIEVKIPSTNGALGDYVWLDTDRDGLQDSNEFGINGVKVNLYDSTNTLIKSMLTTNNPSTGLPGWYYFDKLPFGGYKVTVDATTLPANLQATKSLTGTDRSIDSNGSPATTSLTNAAPIDITLDFGYYPKVSWCTYSECWWKSNPSKWPVTKLTIGGVVYTQAQLLTILSCNSSYGCGSSSNNAGTELLQALVVAKLNYAMGVYESSIKSAMDQADAYLTQYPPSKYSTVKSSSYYCIKQSLDAYNNPNCGCVRRW